MNPSLIRVGFIKYIENFLKIEIQSVLMGNPRVGLVPCVKFAKCIVSNRGL